MFQNKEMSGKKYARRLLFLSIANMVFGSCNLKQEDKHQEAQVQNVVEKKTEEKVDSSNINLLGVWSQDESPVFEIRKDSIYYIDQDKSYPYDIDKDSAINIYYDTYTYKAKINLKNQTTLIIKDSLNDNKYRKE